MDLLGDEATRVYRATVYEDAEFADFFRQVAPIDVIERMQIGSRPTSRAERTGIEALRSIPWMHAWSQCRYMLPGWYGAGSALALAAKQLGEPLLREMCNGWYFFSNLIDDIELALARADLGIAAAYDGLVDEKYRRFIELLRAEYERTRAASAQSARRASAYWTASRPCSARLCCVTRTSTRCTWCRSICCGAGAPAAGNDKELLSALVATVSGIAQALQGA